MLIKGAKELYLASREGVQRLWTVKRGALQKPTDEDIAILSRRGILTGLGAMLGTLAAAKVAQASGIFPGGSGGGASSDTFVMSVMRDGFSPSASTPYYVGFDASAGNPGGSLWYHQIVPVASTLAVVYYSVFVAGTNPSSASVTHKIEKNGTNGVAGTATSGATIDWNGATSNKKTATESPAQSYSAGDSWQYTISTPAWGTAPTSATLAAGLKFTNP